MGKTVAVVGGGYGGASVAKALDAHADVVLIEAKDAFVHAAASLRALVRPEWAPNIFFRYDTLLTNGQVVRERAVSVDPRGVTLASGRRVDADHIVLATGSGYPYPAKTATDESAEALEQLRATHEELARAERVLIAGAGPVGLELAGEIKAAWPDKQVLLVDPARELLPGFLPEVRAELERQLQALGVELHLDTVLPAEPPTEPGHAKPFTVATSRGELSADLWFRAHGVRSNTGILGSELASALTEQGRVRVTEQLTVVGHPTVHAVGDVTDLAENKMAAYAMKHAEVVAANIAARLRGEEPEAVYRPSGTPMALLPLGPNGGVGQGPGPDGPAPVPSEAVAEYKGRDIFLGRFRELFNLA